MIGAGRLVIGRLFPTGKCVINMEQQLVGLERVTDWYFVAGASGNLSKFENIKALRFFVWLTIKDIRSQPENPDIRERFYEQYRVSKNTQCLLEEYFEELRKLDFDLPDGNPEVWRAIFLKNYEQICSLLARDRTDYGSMMLPGTETDINGAGRRVDSLEKDSSDILVPKGPDVETRLYFSAYGHMDVYVGLHRNRWTKFFHYLNHNGTSTGTELLKLWYFSEV